MTNQEIQLPPNPFIKEMLPKHLMVPGSRVLEVGCHTGRNASFAANLGHEVVGIDVDHIALKRASELYRGSDIKWLERDIENEDLRSLGSFDAVICTAVYQDIKPSSRAGVFNRLREVTALGGLHFVVDYIGDRQNARDSFELHDAYRKVGWRVVRAQEDLPKIDTTGALQSQTSIVACKTV